MSGRRVAAIGALLLGSGGLALAASRPYAFVDGGGDHVDSGVPRSS